MNLPVFWNNVWTAPRQFQRRHPYDCASGVLVSSGSVVDKNSPHGGTRAGVRRGSAPVGHGSAALCGEHPEYL